MNFLAHLFFGNTWEERIGNMAEDFLGKDKDISVFPESIQQGMILHRKIDHLNDNHILFYSSMSFIKSIKCGLAVKHICVDVMNDHFLAINWQKYSDQPLERFIETTYLCLEELEPVLPRNLQQVLPQMKTENWLGGYETHEGIAAALNRLDRIFLERRGRQSGLVRTMDDFERHHDELEKNFCQFFPELICAANIWQLDRTLFIPA